MSATARIKALVWRLLSPWVRQQGPDLDALWLTFDDGPHPINTPRILEALAQAGARATFFMVGTEMAAHPALVRAVQAAGHEVALHGHEHRHAADLGWRGQWRDLRAMRRQALSLGLAVRSYRPAYGELTLVRLAWCMLHGVRIVMWNLESRDSFVPDADALVRRLQEHPPRGGDIALFHDDTNLTADALPRLLAMFRERGLALRVPA